MSLTDNVYVEFDLEWKSESDPVLIVKQESGG